MCTEGNVPWKELGQNGGMVKMTTDPTDPGDFLGSL